MLSRNRNEDSMMLERGVDVDHTTIQILLAKSSRVRGNTELDNS